MLWAGIELATSLRSCLSQLLRHAELWLTVAQRKSFNAIPHNFEKRCNDSNALILHPCNLNQARAQASAVFLASTHFSQPLAYPSLNYDTDVNLANTIHNLNITE